MADVDELWKFISETSIDQSGRTGYSRDMLDTWLSMPHFKPEQDMRIVRDAGGEIVAMASVDNRAAHISTNWEGYVTPSRPGEGIGSHLLSWTLAEARGRIDQARAVLAYTLEPRPTLAGSPRYRCSPTPGSLQRAISS